MNSTVWESYLFDDEVQDKSKVSDSRPSEETSSQIQDFLNRTMQLEKENRSEDAIKEYKKLGRPDGKLILPVLMALKGDALLGALYGVAALGRMLEGSSCIALFSMSIIFGYLELFLKPKVVRSVLVLFRLFFYKDGTRKLEQFSRGL